MVSVQQFVWRSFTSVFLRMVSELAFTVCAGLCPVDRSLGPLWNWSFRSFQQPRAQRLSLAALERSEAWWRIGCWL